MSYTKYLVKNPFYTPIPDEYWEFSAKVHDFNFLKHKFNITNFTLKELYKLCKDNAVVFAYHMLGYRMRPYQCMSLDISSKHNRVVQAWSRRAGKTKVNQIFATWSAIFNKYPSILTM